MTTSLYERLGGRDAVNAAVDLFYDKILDDDRINHLFDATDMEGQRAHQKAFLTYAFGGSPMYDGKSLREAHEHLNLNEDHFKAVAEHLEETLIELGVSGDLIQEVMSVAASVHDDVLNV